jgi:hypothetical protein
MIQSCRRLRPVIFCVEMTRKFSQDPAVKTEIEGLGIELLSWTQLRAREGRP